MVNIQQALVETLWNQLDVPIFIKGFPMIPKVQQEVPQHEKQITLFHR
jgi:hypothetical protein